MNTVAQLHALRLQRLTSITFDFLHICISLHYCSIICADSAHQYQILMARACQSFGAQRDVASCRKRESSGKAKQDIFRSVRGSSPSSLLCPRGKMHQRKCSRPPFIPPILPSPCSALSGTFLILLFSSDAPNPTVMDVTLHDLKFWQPPVALQIK